MSATVRYIDCHLHLQDERLAHAPAGVLNRARAGGVAAMFCNGSCSQDWKAVVALAKKNTDVVPFLGLHPWYVDEQPAGWLGELEKSLIDLPAAGIGEIGLDSWKKGLDMAAQERAFIDQLDLADRLDRCVSVHCLKAWGRLMDALRRRGGPRRGMLLHAFGGPAEMIGELAIMGAYFSFAGNVLNERAVKMRASLPTVPLDRLLIETDSPDMPPPQKYRATGLPNGDLNEPANLPGIYRGIAELRSMAVEDLAKQVARNARRFLGNLSPHCMAGF